MGAFEFISCVLAVIALMVYYIKRKYSYWKDMGIPFEEPEFPMGNMKGISRVFHPSQIFHRLYNKLKSDGAPFAGFYIFLSPVVLVTSLDFAKKILVKDNAFFPDRGVYYNEKDGEWHDNEVC